MKNPGEPKIPKVKAKKLVSPGEYAKSRGLSRQVITRQIRQGLILTHKRGGRQKLDPEEADARRRQNLDPANGGKTAREDDPALMEARRRKEVALAEIRRMEADLKAGKLVWADEIQKEIFKIYRAVRDAILAIPDRIAPVITPMSDERAIRALLSKELQDALSRSADACSG